MRQKTKNIVTVGNNGYALTQKKAFDNIMKRINITKDDCFLDVGCGKGGVLHHASYYPFKRIAGVEIEYSLFNVAVKNFEKLQMPQIELFHDNAITFERYDEFNVLFMFNPFVPSIYEKVMDSICETLNKGRFNDHVYIICYGGTITEYIQAKGLLRRTDNYWDDVRGTSVNIWRWEK